MKTQHTEIPWKRWNQKGSTHAHRRMDELRARAGQSHKSDLIDRWCEVTGRPRKEWWDEAQKSGLRAGCGNAASIAFLESAISKATKAQSGTEG